MYDKMTPFDIRFLMKINELGIIPFCNSGKEFREALATLPPGERRETKRKFRKVWRKMMKQCGRKKTSAFLSDLFYPSEEKRRGNPSRRTKSFRQKRVLNHFRAEVQREMNKKG
jgi:hypothetical protein